MLLMWGAYSNIVSCASMHMSSAARCNMFILRSFFCLKKPRRKGEKLSGNKKKPKLKDREFKKNKKKLKRKEKEKRKKKPRLNERG